MAGLSFWPLLARFELAGYSFHIEFPEVIVAMRMSKSLSALLAVIAVAIGIFWLSFNYFRSIELATAEGRLSLYRSTVTAELQRFSHLTHILAQDPFVIETAGGKDTSLLNRRLKEFAKKSGLDFIFLLGTNGITIAASNAGEPSSFVGQSYSFRPYFQMAMKGEQGRFYGIGATTGLPGYFIANAVRSEEGVIVGVITIKIDLSRLQDRWREAGEQVLLVNHDGVVLLASDPVWRYRLLDKLSPTQQAAIEASRQFTGQRLEPLAWRRLGKDRARIGGDDRLHLITNELPHDWSLHYFASDDRALTRSWLVTGLVVMLAAFGLIFFQLQRTRRIGAALARSEQEEAQLRQANERLAVEIAERRDAERRLQKTQNELERASRLAALGRLSSLVTHELGQPIAAMRNHLAAAEMSAQAKPALIERVGGLIDRMEGITRQLKFFAGNREEEFENVNLYTAMQASLGLIDPNLAEFGVNVAFDKPQEAVIVRGNRLRIEQVMTNLLRNAVDAAEESDDPAIEIRIGEAGTGAWFEILDNGHGLGEATLEDLQEPFVTTRESGRGMGLGLAISAGIVSDHGGVMSARNREEGGAIFRVEFAGQQEKTE